MESVKKLNNLVFNSLGVGLGSAGGLTNILFASADKLALAQSELKMIAGKISPEVYQQMEASITDNLIRYGFMGSPSVILAGVSLGCLINNVLTYNKKD